MILSTISNSNLLIQVVSLPNLHIIDYGYGFPGSTHDSSAWTKTKVYENHDNIFEQGEFIWGDSAYPICYFPIELDFRNLSNISQRLRLGW